MRSLEEALANVKALQTLLPMCAYCKSIRNDQNYWEKVETYFSQHSGVSFTHSYCPSCYERFVRPELEALERQLGKLRTGAGRLIDSYVDRAWQLKKNPGEAHVPWRIQQVIDKVKARGYVLYPGKLTVADSFRIGCIGRLYPQHMEGALLAVREVLDEMRVSNGGPALAAE